MLKALINTNPAAALGILQSAGLVNNSGQVVAPDSYTNIIFATSDIADRLNSLAVKELGDSIGVDSESGAPMLYNAAGFAPLPEGMEYMNIQPFMSISSEGQPAPASAQQKSNWAADFKKVVDVAGAGIGGVSSILDILGGGCVKVPASQEEPSEATKKAAAKKDNTTFYIIIAVVVVIVIAYLFFSKSGLKRTN